MYKAELEIPAFRGGIVQYMAECDGEKELIWVFAGRRMQCFPSAANQMVLYLAGIGLEVAIIEFPGVNGLSVLAHVYRAQWSNLSPSYKIA